jgi:hypothetical protein
VPDGTRDLKNGELIHDDLVISAALLSLLDDKRWDVTGQAVVVQARDPLDEMKKF